MPKLSRILMWADPSACGGLGFQSAARQYAGCPKSGPSLGFHAARIVLIGPAEVQATVIPAGTKVATQPARAQIGPVMPTNWALLVNESPENPVESRHGSA
jgi:hypothetical protein